MSARRGERLDWFLDGKVRLFLISRRVTGWPFLARGEELSKIGVGDDPCRTEIL
jgi:hypothetical protein